MQQFVAMILSTYSVFCHKVILPVKAFLKKSSNVYIECTISFKNAYKNRCDEENLVIHVAFQIQHFMTD